MGGKHLGRNPTDRWKLGTKRSVFTDGGGVPIGLAIEGANRHDFKMAWETIERIPVEPQEASSATPQDLCLEKDYDNEVRDLLAECGFTARIRARGEEAKALTLEVGFNARRWVVERTHRWMNRFRRILIRWDKKVRHYLGFFHGACALITKKQFGLLGIGSQLDICPLGAGIKRPFMGQEDATSGDTAPHPPARLRVGSSQTWRCPSAGR